MSVELTNLTIFPKFKNPLSLRNIFELLPCVNIKDEFFDKKKKIPYFGVEDIIISIKSEHWGMRGFRNQTREKVDEGSMKNCNSIDFQKYGKNTNIKISKLLFQILSVKSREQGFGILDAMIDTINGVDPLWKEFFKLDQNERNEFINNYIVKTVLYKNSTILDTNNQILIERYIVLEKQLINENKENLIGVTKLLISLTDFYKTKDMFIKKMSDIIKLETNEDSVFTLNGKFEYDCIERIDGIYNGTLGQSDLILSFIVMKLLDMEIECSFSNEKEKTIKINRYIEIIDDYGETDNILIQININSSGAVKALSRGRDDFVIDEIIKVLEIIEEIISDENYPNNKNINMGEKLRNFILLKHSNDLIIDSEARKLFSEDCQDEDFIYQDENEQDEDEDF